MRPTPFPTCPSDVVALSVAEFAYGLDLDRSVPIDVRVVAATNLPAERLSDETRFRQDLLFRLNTIEIHLPPLRARGST